MMNRDRDALRAKLRGASYPQIADLLNAIACELEYRGVLRARELFDVVRDCYLVQEAKDNLAKAPSREGESDECIRRLIREFLKGA